MESERQYIETILSCNSSYSEQEISEMEDWQIKMEIGWD